MHPRILVLCLGLALAGLIPSAARADCETILPTSSVTVGMTGTGYTVAVGRVQEPFTVEVLGILPDAVSPGRDLIIVEASSPRIDNVGIWAGMSGSPVYLDGSGELMGVVSYSFANGASTIGGLTPAEDIDDLNNLPPSTTSLTGRGGSDRTVHLKGPLAREIARRTGKSMASTFAGLKPLAVPLSVSGATPRGFASLSEKLKGFNTTFIPYAGGSADRQIAAPVSPIVAGDNFASIVSYGDVTIGAIGTMSYVCGGTGVAFGHPILFDGHIQWGANAADAITVVPDAVLSPYKMANVAETIGSVDQDRLAGSRILIGTAPTATPIDAEVTSADTGRTRIGHSEVVDSDWASQVLFYGLGGNMYSIFDSLGGGSASFWWVFDGTRANGDPWHFERGNRYAYSFALADEAAYSVAIQLDALLFATDEDIEVTNVSVSTTVEETQRAVRVHKLLVSKNGGPFRAKQAVSVRPGTRLKVKVVLRPVEPGPDQTEVLSFRVPLNGPPVGEIVVGGPTGGGFDWYEEDDGSMTFDDLLVALKSVERNDVLQGRMFLGFEGNQRQRRAARLTSVVRGSKTLQLIPAHR